MYSSVLKAPGESADLRMRGSLVVVGVVSLMRGLAVRHLFGRIVSPAVKIDSSTEDIDSPAVEIDSWPGT